MLNKILLLPFLALGFYIHDLMRIAVGLFYKSNLIEYYKLSKSDYSFIGFINLIPFIAAVCIVLIKNKDLCMKSCKKRDVVFYSMCIGLMLLNILFHFDYWKQMYTSRVSSTTALSIPLWVIISLILLPVLYFIGKVIYALTNKNIIAK